MKGCPIGSKNTADINFIVRIGEISGHAVRKGGYL